MSIEPIGPVFVGVDGSLASLEAVDLAVEEAGARMTPLVVVHATDEPGQQSRAQRMLAVATARALASRPGLAVEGMAGRGEPVDVLVQSSAAASLLVVGHRRHVGQAGNAGTTATRIVGRSAVPVLVHRMLDIRATDRQARPVLVGVGGVGGVDEVLEFAFEEAALRGAALMAVHVRSHLDAVGSGLMESEAALRQAIAGWADKHPGVSASGMIRYGVDVPLPLVAASRMAQLIVVGAPSTGRSENAGSTSVSGFLVRRAHCSVAVVPR